MKLSLNHRPARLLVGFVVLILPSRAAACATVAGNRHQAVLAVAITVLPHVFLPIATLLQFSMAGRAPPVPLDSGAGLAKCWCWARFVCHDVEAKVDSVRRSQHHHVLFFCTLDSAQCNRAVKRHEAALVLDSQSQ